ncbi:DUF4331 domain-containing protein [Leptothrix discophora]|uniref:DUF4331 domain-containing protein n=1 Tax=Leptothrix discophora TaxID=89 RepID=A0ABT9G4I2_LEPDI|nr:DUF4331 domain-containing protein [Leptothrix discophora]MDP4301098.1 DUF4331 domain-containing protein [Leptothrix discophora]
MTRSTRSLPPHALTLATLAALAALASPSTALASSHREAPFITSAPKVDATDFYLFNSYEAGRSGYVTLIANYQPLQDAYGGPNYFSLDPNALYEIHVDNDGDARENLTFQFRFRNALEKVALDIGGKPVAIPLIQAGTVANVRDANLNLRETYTVDVVRGDRRKGSKAALTNVVGGSATFDKPVDHIGVKTLPDYPAYAARHVHSVNIPGCAQPGKLFVGQRKDPFAVNLGTIFDLVNAPASVLTNPALIHAAPNPLADKNVTTLALEVHKSCLTNGTDPVIGGWTTASLRQGRLLNGAPGSGHHMSEKTGGAWTQVSRLGNPLVNEVVIGLPDKDRFNASKPKDDLQFATYVTNPSLPRLLEIALGTPAGGLAPSNLPRTDLLNTFLTGLAGVNRPMGTVTPAEMLRLNTAIAAVPLAQQNRLGVAGEVLRVGGAGNLGAAVDLAGFPNGRRPNDDVVDIALVAVAGGLCVLNSEATLGAITAGSNANVLGLNSFTIPGSATLTSECRVGKVPLGATSAALHDAVDQASDANKASYLAGFPYLATPLGGTRN